MTIPRTITNGPPSKIMIMMMMMMMMMMIFLTMILTIILHATSDMGTRHRTCVRFFLFASLPLCLAAFSSNCYRLFTIVFRLSQSRKLCNKTTAHIHNSTFFMPWFYVPFCPVSYWSVFFLIEILGRKIVSKKVSNLPKIAFFLNSIHHGRTWCYLMLPHLFSLMNRHLFFLLSLYGRVFWTGFDANYANFSWTYFYRVLCEPSYPRL